MSLLLFPNIFLLITLLQYYFQYFYFFIYALLCAYIYLMPTEEEFNWGTLQE